LIHRHAAFDPRDALDQRRVSDDYQSASPFLADAVEKVVLYG